MTRLTNENGQGKPPADLVTLATPAGRSAVATVLLDGPHATQQVDAFFHAASGRSLETTPLNQIVFGKWQKDAEQVEELVVCRRSALRIEIHCHGGTVAPESIINSLVKAGCRRIGWPQWLCSVDGDALRIEAHIALANARTQRTAKILLAQYGGTLARTVETLCRHLAAGETSRASQIFNRLLSLADLGIHLARDWQLVLAGPANAGKSSLINAILGYDRAIVFNQPGTTRDVVSAETVIDGWPIEISDTAGLRIAAEAVEAVGVDRARTRAATADLLVLVFDASLPWDDHQEGLRRQHPDALLVHNKCDLTVAKTTRPPGIYTCAVSGDGVEPLIRQIGLQLVPNVPQAGEAVPFTERQVTLLSKAAKNLDVDDRQQVIKLLQEILKGRPSLDRVT